MTRAASPTTFIVALTVSHDICDTRLRKQGRYERYHDRGTVPVSCSLTLIAADTGADTGTVLVSANEYKNRLCFSQVSKIYYCSIKVRNLCSMAAAWALVVSPWGSTMICPAALAPMPLIMPSLLRVWIASIA